MRTHLNPVKHILIYSNYIILYLHARKDKGIDAALAKINADFWLVPEVAVDIQVLKKISGFSCEFLSGRLFLFLELS